MATKDQTKHYLVFDVESMGLHGEGFAVGGSLFNHRGERLDSFLFCCPTEGLYSSPEDRAWINDNVPLLPAMYNTPRDIRDAFWSYYTTAKKEYDNLMVAAETPWPVESNFLSACIKDDPSRHWEGPYPLLDISSVMFTAGEDPLTPVPRDESELPYHHPGADAYASANILFKLIK
jgi:hypothetical protein